MSLWQTYRSFSPKTRAGLGAGLILWGLLGLQLTPKAEEKLGLTPSEADKAALDKMTPKIHAIPREKS
ncbi:hypothetical protein MMYC01_210449 [Madurella mycetomatis]|uniref:Uncharacterized protein n=1 Tax=Madurella mycetomatis TaxID=100816 RepID=A0A175VPX4_9PEZI|nr:hypothetical protein MMYC01_210449 [Madurella mycetomatis]